MSKLLKAYFVLLLCLAISGCGALTHKEQIDQAKAVTIASEEYMTEYRGTKLENTEFEKRKLRLRDHPEEYSVKTEKNNGNWLVHINLYFHITGEADNSTQRSYKIDSNTGKVLEIIAYQ